MQEGELGDESIRVESKSVGVVSVMIDGGNSGGTVMREQRVDLGLSYKGGQVRVGRDEE